MENYYVYIDALKKMRKKLQEGEMSALIGGGFSKNANKEFPSWKELLYDLTMEMYKKEIEFKYTLLVKSKDPVKDIKQFYEEEVTKIIHRKGHLDLVSEYIKFKGFREAISTYIEEKLLPIDSNSNNELDLHKKLLELPWNNVYTTNYDKQLEYANFQATKQIKTNLIEAKKLRQAALDKKNKNKAIIDQLESEIREYDNNAKNRKQENSIYEHHRNNKIKQIDEAKKKELELNKNYDLMNLKYNIIRREFKHKKNKNSLLFEMQRN